MQRRDARRRLRVRHLPPSHPLPGTAWRLWICGRGAATPGDAPEHGPSASRATQSRRGRKSAANHGDATTDFHLNFSFFRSKRRDRNIPRECQGL